MSKETVVHFYSQIMRIITEMQPHAVVMNVNKGIKENQEITLKFCLKHYKIFLGSCEVFHMIRAGFWEKN